jgi:murein DD-endopeptidase MepM/ murein hydrolase activator NlpD
MLWRWMSVSKRKIYYLTLFTSVFIVSAATILLYRSGIHQSGNNGDTGNTKANDASAWTMMAGTKEDDAIADDQANAADGETIDEGYVTPVLQDVAVPSENIESLISMAVPVLGRTVLEYAMDKMVYSKTLEEYRAHPGIDIESEIGQAVTASADGTVVSIYNDDRFGMTVVVEHGNNFKSIYSNLSNDVAVLPNQLISKGELLGYVGNTARIEAIEQPHIHFEVHYMGKPVDPERFLSKANEEELE